jgi:fructose/tagatose bisphosphate aldolase
LSWSGVYPDIVNIARKYGAKLEKTEGVPDSQIRLAIQNGIRKINTDTDLRLAFTAGVRKVLAEKKLTYKIIDSVYNTSVARGCIVEQNPPADFKVKENRTIFSPLIRISFQFSGKPS